MKCCPSLSFTPFRVDLVPTKKSGFYEPDFQSMRSSFIYHDWTSPNRAVAIISFVLNPLSAGGCFIPLFVSPRYGA